MFGYAHRAKNISVNTTKLPLTSKYLYQELIGIPHIISYFTAVIKSLLL